MAKPVKYYAQSAFRVARHNYQAGDEVTDPNALASLTLLGEGFVATSPPKTPTPPKEI